MISLSDFCFSRSGGMVLDRVNFTAGAGEFVAITGPNGAGKSTMLQALAGVLPGGVVDPRKIAFVEQGASVAFGMRVDEVVALGRLAHGDSLRAPVVEAMRVCGITEFAARRVDRISGGELRRVMLARALAGEPRVLLLDEPVADLDPAAAHFVMRMLGEFAQAGGCVVAVLHAIDLASVYASRMVVMAGGRILGDGKVAEMLLVAASAFGMRVGVETGERLLPLV